MNDPEAAADDDADERPRSPAEITRELRLRPELPRVMRISRKALVVIAAFTATGLGGALILALQSKDSKSEIEELYSTGRAVPAEAVSSLPRDYGAIPQLGPPLPGDFGRPMLRQAVRDGVPVSDVAGSAATARPVDPIVQQRRQEQAAAIRSSLFLSRSASSPSSEPISDTARDAPSPIASRPVSSPQTAAARREAFLAPARSIGAPTGLAPLTSTHLLLAGSMVPAALITGIRADLPGQVIAQVTEPVRDSATGRVVIIPQGARLIGSYDSDIAAGQSRLLLAWTRLILPDGRSFDLDRLPAADASGQAGLQDRTDYHWGGLFRAALISTVLGIGAQGGSTDEESEIARAIRDGTSDTVGRTGRQVVERELSRPPTISIRPGYPIRAMLARDLALPEYSSSN